MTSFIKQENQTILWNTIQKVDLFHRVLSPTQKPLWFKSIIEVFYEKYKHTRLSRLDLENLNKQTLEYMVKSLKNMQTHGLDQTQRGYGTSPPSKQLRDGFISQQKRVTFQEQVNLGSPPINGGVPLDFRPEFSSNLEKKTIQSKQYVSELSSRQQEYDQMMTREIPNEINFKEELSDDVIKNMDELLEQQRKQRELDLASIATEPIIPTQPRRIQPAIVKPNTNYKKTLVIEDESTEPIKLPILDLEPLEYTQTIDILKEFLELKESISAIKQLLTMYPSMKEREHENNTNEK